MCVCACYARARVLGAVQAKVDAADSLEDAAKKPTRSPALGEKDALEPTDEAPDPKHDSSQPGTLIGDETVIRPPVLAESETQPFQATACLFFSQLARARWHRT